LISAHAARKLKYKNIVIINKQLIINKIIQFKNKNKANFLYMKELIKYKKSLILLIIILNVSQSAVLPPISTSQANSYLTSNNIQTIPQLFASTSSPDTIQKNLDLINTYLSNMEQKYQNKTNNNINTNTNTNTYTDNSNNNNNNQPQTYYNNNYYNNNNYNNIQTYTSTVSPQQQNNNYNNNNNNNNNNVQTNYNNNQIYTSNVMPQQSNNININNNNIDINNLNTITSYI
jgi:hypothetical protein